MYRTSLTLLLALVFTTSASATTLKFVPGTVPVDQNPLSVVGSDIMELSDVPNPAPNDFQFNAITAIDVEVIANDGTLPVTFTLARAATANDKLNLIFNNATYNNLVMGIDIPGLVKGDPIPSGVITDADGVVFWNAPGLSADTAGNITLAGTLEGTKLIPVVPEPTGMAAILAAMIGMVHFVRRR